MIREYDSTGSDTTNLELLAIRDNTRLGDYYTAPLRLVATIQDQIVGFAALTVGSGPCKHCGTLRIHISSAWRGGGTGDALMQYVLVWAEDNGITRIEATPYACDDFLAKKRFFERYGFVVEGWKRKAVVRENDGAVIDVILLARVV